MSTVFSKNKEKRPRSSSESNRSFVRNVTSRVSGLLPATITKWFSSPSSNSNGSAQVAEATDSSTEDEAPESPITMQPPAKRMRYTSPGNFNQFVPVETRCTSTNTETVDDNIYDTAHSPISRSDYRREANLMSTRLHSNNDESTDGVIQESAFFKSQHSLSTIGHPISKKRKSLFDNTNVDSYKKRSPPYSGDVRDPYFKPTLLSSPFYVGRTMYGGAASSSMTEPNIKQRKMSLINETSDNDSVTISQSARRVMDLLEHYSSPLIEGRRIPQVARNYEKNSSINTSQSVSPYGPKVFSYKTQELYVPTVASILTIKRKSRLMDTTNAARQIIASHSSTSELLPYPTANSEGNSANEVSGGSFTTKIKSRLTRTNRERNIEVEYNSPDTVNLPTAVLQMDKDNLPKFTFGSTASLQSLQSSSVQTPVTTALDSSKRTVDANKTSYKTNDSDNLSPEKEENDNDNYKFSCPVTVSNESTSTSPSLPKFCFGSPERDVDKVQEGKKKDDQLGENTSNQVVENKLPALKSSDWKCLDCWVLNKADANNCVCCGGKKPVEITDNPKLCSVCNVSPSRPEYDKCVECEKKTSKIDNVVGATGKNTSKWKCSDCWVDNDEKVDKCVCCGAKNTKKSAPAITVNTFENIEKEWKCNDCWIKNKSILDKCAACGGQKPGSNFSSTNFDKDELPKSNHGTTEGKESKDNVFKNIAKSQNEKWECPLCLVRNDGDRSTCICCEADKPGTIKECHKRLFNFHQPSEITFKFGIQPKEESKKQDHVEPEECNMGEESETNNNFLPKTPTFNFGLTLKKIGEQPASSMEKSEEPPKINFSFGVAKQDIGSPVKNPIFGIPNKLPDVTTNTEDKEKPQVVPQVFTSSVPEEKQKEASGIFSIPVSSNITPQTPALVPLQMASQSSVTKVETPFSNASAIPITKLETKTQQNNFTFAPIRPVKNLFATTSTATTNVAGSLSLSTPAISSGSVFQPVNAITTSTGVFFQNTDSVTKTVPLFSKTESTTTTASISLGITQPVFSFGNQAPLAQPEKPKFNFNFGSSKTETPSLFKPTFGVSNNNNDSVNKFNLSNSINAGNGITGMPLNHPNQVNIANPLTSGNSVTSPTSNLFGAAVQKENMWSTNNNMLFTSNVTPNVAQKPPTFTFGSATAFNTNNATFGSTTQPAQNVFGITNQTTTSQPSLFGNQLQSQTSTNIFGSPQNSSNPMQMTMFGNPNPSVTPAFGNPNSSTPSFETPTMAPAPVPAFNFGSSQSTGIFGFGQPQQSQVPPSEAQQPAQVPQAGMYNFGAPAGAAPQLQFNMGSVPNTFGRRVIRKAMRRTQR